MNYIENIYRFINLQINIKSFSKDTFWSLSSQAFIVFINFATVYILANLMSLNDYGQFKLITTWLAITLGIGYTGYNYLLPQMIAQNQNYDLKLIFIQTFLKSLPTSVLLLSFSFYYLINQNINLGYGFMFASILAPILCAASLVNIYYMSKRNFIKFALMQNSVDVLQLISLLISLLLFDNFIYIIILYFVSTILANSLIIFLSYTDDRNYKLNKKLDYKMEKLDTYQVRSKLNFSNIVLGFTYQLDKLLIFHFIGALQLAVYSIVTAISDQARTPIKALSVVLFPRIASKQISYKRMLFITLGLFFLAFSITVLLLFLNPIIFKYIFPKYIEYLYLANITTFSILLSPISFIYIYAQSINRLNLMNQYTHLNSFLNVLLFSIAIFYKSLVLFIYFKMIIIIISGMFLLFKLKKNN